MAEIVACNCGKYSYRSVGEAERAGRHWHGRNNGKQLRPYRCAAGNYHLTSGDRRDNKFKQLKRSK